MKRITLTILTGLFLVSNAYALNLSRVKTWSAEVLTHTDLNAEFNNILNHSISNADVASDAAIAASKLDQSVAGAIGATTPSTGAFTTLSSTSNVTFDTSTFVLDATTNNIGIGRTSPTTQLHLTGTLTAGAVTTTGTATVAGLTATGNLDIGAYDLRAATITPDGLTSGRVVFATTNGTLTDDTDMTFATDTLTITKIAGVTAFTAGGDLDIGSYELRAQTLESDVATGTAPFTIASTTKSTNLNADLWDDLGTTASITSVGTIATGVWQGTDIALGYGGMGSKKIDSGSVAVNATSTANISFAFTFGATPSLTLGVFESTDAAQYQGLITAISTTGATLSNNNSQNETFYWISVGSE